MKTITVPSCFGSVLNIVINNVTYALRAGDTVTVPTQVAEVIDNMLALMPVSKKPETDREYAEKLMRDAQKYADLILETAKSYADALTANDIGCQVEFNETNYDTVQDALDALAESANPEA